MHDPQRTPQPPTGLDLLALTLVLVVTFAVIHGLPASDRAHALIAVAAVLGSVAKVIDEIRK
jgi:hypothetical protein